MTQHTPSMLPTFAIFALTACLTVVLGCTDDRRTYSSANDDDDAPSNNSTGNNGTEANGGGTEVNNAVDVNSGVDGPFDGDVYNNDYAEGSDTPTPDPNLTPCSDVDGALCVGVAQGEWEEDSYSYGSVERDGSHTLPEAWFRYDVWVVNRDEGTISRFDPRTGVETGRFVGVTPGSGVDRCQSRAQHCPSQIVAVHSGMVWVGSDQPTGGPPSLTVIATHVEEGETGPYEWFTPCEDRNGDGRINTSSDVNGDGRINVNDPNEFPGEDDECLLGTIVVGDEDDHYKDLVVVPYTGGHGGGNTAIAYMQSGKVFSMQSYGAGLAPLTVLAETTSPVQRAVTTRSGLVWAADENGSIVGGSAFRDVYESGVAEVIPTCRQAVGAPTMAIDADGCAIAFQPGCEGGVRVCYTWEDETNSYFVEDLDGASLALLATFAGGVTSYEGDVLRNYKDDTTVTIEASDALRESADLEKLHAFAPGAPGVQAWAIDGSKSRVLAIDLESGLVEPLAHTVSGEINDIATLGAALEGVDGSRGQVQENIALECPAGTALASATLEWDGDVEEGTTIDVRLGSSATPEDWVAMPFGPYTETTIDLMDEDPNLETYLVLEFGLSSSRWDARPTLHGFQIVYTCE